MLGVEEETTESVCFPKNIDSFDLDTIIQFKLQADSSIFFIVQMDEKGQNLFVPIEPTAAEEQKKQGAMCVAIEAAAAAELAKNGGYSISLPDGALLPSEQYIETDHDDDCDQDEDYSPSNSKGKTKAATRASKSAKTIISTKRKAVAPKTAQESLKVAVAEFMNSCDGQFLWHKGLKKHSDQQATAAAWNKLAAQTGEKGTFCVNFICFSSFLNYNVIGFCLQLKS